MKLQTSDDRNECIIIQASSPRFMKTSHLRRVGLSKYNQAIIVISYLFVLPHLQVWYWLWSSETRVVAASGITLRYFFPLLWPGPWLCGWFVGHYQVVWCESLGHLKAQMSLWNWNKKNFVTLGTKLITHIIAG